MTSSESLSLYVSPVFCSAVSDGVFIVSAAFKKLDALYGTWRAPSTMKKGFNLPSTKMANTDLAALLKAPEILRVCRRPKYVLLPYIKPIQRTSR